MTKISKELKKKILFEKTYDTKKYRYVVYNQMNPVPEIRRIEKKYLGTTTALNWENWEVIK